MENMMSIPVSQVIDYDKEYKLKGLEKSKNKKFINR